MFKTRAENVLERRLATVVLAPQDTIREKPLPQASRGATDFVVYITAYGIWIQNEINHPSPWKYHGSVEELLEMLTEHPDISLGSIEFIVRKHLNKDRPVLVM